MSENKTSVLKRRGGSIISSLSRPLLVLLICVVIALLEPKFLKMTNLMNVLRQSSLLLIMSLGMLFVMLLGRGMDLSIGATLSITSCFAAYVMNINTKSVPIMLLGMLVGIVIGVAVGALNGSLVAYLKLPAVLVTYGTQRVIRGIAYLLMSETVIRKMPPFITYIGTASFLGVSLPVWISLGFTIIVSLILVRTSFGRRFFLVGANDAAADYSGIDSKKTVVWGFVLNALFATLAGFIYIGRLSAAEAQIGEDFHFNAISACAIGGVLFTGGVGSPWGVVCGAMILMLLQNGMNLMGIAADWNKLVQGLAIIIAVLLDFMTRRKNNSR